MDKKQKLELLKDIKNPLRITNRDVEDLKSRVDKIEQDPPLPIKGVDYFTEEELQGMCEYVQSQIHQGVDGEQGIQGEKGEQGIQGETGPQGEQGPAGRNGIDGETPDINKIIKEVIKQIPKPKDGKSPDILEVVALVKKELNLPETDKVMMKDDLITFLKKGGFRGGGATLLSQLQDVNLSNLTQTNGKYDLGSGKVKTIVAGSNITVDSTDPQNPIVSSTATTTSEISIVTGMDGGGASSTYGGTLGRPIIYGGHASTYFPSENTIIGGGLATTTGIPFSGGLA